MNVAQTISHYQPLLQTIAYNIVRCKHDAQDIVQETFMKYLLIDQKKVENTKAYLIKAVTNNCINHLNTLKRKKEYFDSIDFTEMVHRFKETNLAHLDLDVNLSAAFKVMQAKLEPLERAVYVLKEVFDLEYEEVQLALNKKKDHCRQLFCRAKKKLNDETSKINFEFKDVSKLIDDFKNACQFGNSTEFVLELTKELAFPSEKE